jgi:hypothetical protein
LEDREQKVDSVCEEGVGRLQGGGMEGRRICGRIWERGEGRREGKKGEKEEGGGAGRRCR